MSLDAIPDPYHRAQVRMMVWTMTAVENDLIARSGDARRISLTRLSQLAAAAAHVERTVVEIQEAPCGEDDAFRHLLYVRSLAAGLEEIDPSLTAESLAGSILKSSQSTYRHLDVLVNAPCANA